MHRLLGLALAGALAVVVKKYLDDVVRDWGGADPPAPLTSRATTPLGSLGDDDLPLPPRDLVS